jgi:hypothetical protein
VGLAAGSLIYVIGTCLPLDKAAKDGIAVMPKESIPRRPVAPICAQHRVFAARLPDATITVAAPHETAYFNGNVCVWVTE